MLLLAENARQAFEGILGQTPTTPVITPTATPVISPVATPTVTDEGLARDALRRSLDQYRSQFVNRGVENPTTRQHYVIETPAWLYDGAVTYARSLIRVGGAVTSSMASTARARVEGLMQALNYRRGGNLLAARRDDIPARDLADIAVRYTLAIYTSTLATQGVTSPTIRQSSETHIGKTFESIVAAARKRLTVPYYWKIERLNYVVRNTAKISAAKNAVPDALSAYNYAPGAPVTPTVTPVQKAIVTPIVTPLPTPVPTPIVTPVLEPSPKAVVAPPAPVKKGIDRDRIAAILTSTLKAYHIPSIPGTISPRTWNSVTTSTANQYMKEKYPDPRTWPETEYNAALEATVAELNKRGYSRGQSVQESLFEPAPGLTPTIEMEYPYATPQELLNAAYYHAFSQVEIKAGTRDHPTLLSKEDCGRIKGLVAGFIRQARGADAGQKEMAIEAISVQKDPTGAYVDPFEQALYQRFGAVCLPKIRPEDLVDMRPEYNETMIIWRRYLATLPTKLVRTQLLDERGQPKKKGEALAVLPERYDAYVGEKVEQVMLQWSGIPRSLRKREPSGTSEWRRLVAEALAKAEIYRGREAVPTTVAMRGQQITEEMAKRVIRLVLETRIRNIGLPPGPLILHPNVFKDIVDSESVKARNIIDHSNAYELTHGTAEELLTRTRPGGTAMRAGIFSEALAKRIPDLTGRELTQMGYYRGPVGVMPVNYATPAEFERIYPQHRAAALLRAVDRVLYGHNVSRNSTVSDTTVWRKMVDMATRVAKEEAAPLEYDYTIEEAEAAFRHLGVRPSSAVTPTVFTPVLTPAVTPVATQIRAMTTTQAARLAVQDVLRTLDTRKTERRMTAGKLYTLVDPQEYDRLMGDSHQRALEIMRDAGQDGTRTPSSEWMRLIRSVLTERGFLRSPVSLPRVAVTPAATVPLTPVTRAGVRLTARDLLIESVGGTLAQKNMPDRATRESPLYLPDAGWRALVGDILAMSTRLVQTERYRQSQEALYGRVAISTSDIGAELRRRYILPESERPALPTPVITPAATPALPPEEMARIRLDEWAKTAPVFRDYAQCRAAAEREVGATPNRFFHCITEQDLVDQAVSNALELADYPVTPTQRISVPGSDYDRIVNEAVSIANTMMSNRVYAAIYRGRYLKQF